VNCSPPSRASPPRGGALRISTSTRAFDGVDSIVPRHGCGHAAMARVSRSCAAPSGAMRATRTSPASSWSASAARSSRSAA
jgi:hypothetical protein